MMKLTNTEKELMEVFWSSEKALTSVDISEMQVKSTWSKNFIQNMIRSLLKKGVLKECGVAKYNTQYARKFLPLVTREQYAAEMALSVGLTPQSVPKVMVALAQRGEGGDSQEIIHQLEEVIKELKEGNR